MTPQESEVAVEALAAMRELADRAVVMAQQITRLATAVEEMAKASKPKDTSISYADTTYVERIQDRKLTDPDDGLDEGDRYPEWPNSLDDD